MESEEVQIRKLMFEKNLALILAEHVKIDVDQFKAMEKEFRSVLKEHLSSESATSFSDFRTSVNLCLKLLKKCPTKELLDKEVKEKVLEMCP